MIGEVLKANIINELDGELKQEALRLGRRRLRRVWRSVVTLLEFQVDSERIKVQLIAKGVSPELAQAIVSMVLNEIPLTNREVNLIEKSWDEAPVAMTLTAMFLFLSLFVIWASQLIQCIQRPNNAALILVGATSPLALVAGAFAVAAVSGLIERVQDWSDRKRSK